ncbi:hypothetical protein [Luteolibacter marinus]|uniref:hypothetical protein n=1 Tax=Luteolibacter marinus TaxID=2776705 RepID=UPI001868B399|nr:hypothetical protein [Luteolibacter marinus]
MKRAELLIPLFAMVAAAATPVEAVDFIRQIQLIDGKTIVYDIPVSGTSGSVISKPLEGDGAVFQLYAFENENYSPWSLLDLNAGSDVHANVSLDSHLVDLDLLGIDVDLYLGSPDDDQELPRLIDEKTVGTHLPRTVVTLSSVDSYRPARTRADQLFALSIGIRGLADPADPQGGISAVDLDRAFKLYHPDLHVPYPNGAGQGSYEESIRFRRNGDFNDPEIFAMLPAARPTKAIGEETFTARVALDSSGRQVSIGSATIQIWPVCDASFEEIVADKRYTGIPGGARVVLGDLYPDSVTYAQIYKGDAELGRVGRVIASSVVSFNTYAPQNAVVPLVMGEEHFDGDGTYTIEILTTTPFNDRKPERVDHLSFELDRTLQVRGMFAGAE